MDAFKGSAKDFSITPPSTFRAHFWRSNPSPMCDFRIQEMETFKGTSRCLVFELQSTRVENNYSLQSQLIIIEPIYENNNGLKIGMG